MNYIHGQPSLFIMKFHKSEASISENHGEPADVNEGLQNLFHTPTVTPKLRIMAEAPSENRNNAAPTPTLQQRVLAAIMMAGKNTLTAPFERMKLITQTQSELIKSGRLSHSYKGIGDCFARTVSNEGIISLWRGNTAHLIGSATYQVTYIGFANCFGILFNYKKEKDGFWKDLAKAMGLHAATSVLAYPLEYAHTRLANDTKSDRTSGRQFNGLVDVYRKTLKSDGIVGLYRGYSIAFVHSFSTMMVVDALRRVEQLQQSQLPTTVVGSGLFVCAGLATYPLDTVRRRMMMRSGEAVKYKSSLDAFSQILRNEGVASLYKGACAFVLKAAIGCGLLLAGFAIVSPKKKNSSDESGKPYSSFNIRWSTRRDGGQDIL